MQLPLGYFSFHSKAFINYQLNRCYSLGYARKQDLENAGKQLRTLGDAYTVFRRFSDEARGEGRLKNAASYLRLAEFFLDPADSNKGAVYEEYVQLFDEAFLDEDYVRLGVPYGESNLHCLHFPPRKQEVKGYLLAIGGFDSLIEEFFCFWKYFAEAGYHVLAFEGPGQGGTLRKHGLVFDHDYEKPVAAVLDHFNIDRASLIGISMGGYWAIRAAAFEKRIRRVIAFPPVYDWMELTNNFNRSLVGRMMKMPGFMNFSIRLKMMSGLLKHAVNQARYISGGKEPIDAVRWMLGMNKEHLHSWEVDQDVFLATGENDAFQPPLLLQKQEAALSLARSVTTRVFRKDEHADQHCQIGNVQLALDTINNWLERFPEDTEPRIPKAGSYNEEA
ncbi:MAG: alpha/beta fold hydrolase [Bacteroidetes bacterium]|nr:alpha/beta fold hydrolase [Bacteroidota bacterium]